MNVTQKMIDWLRENDPSCPRVAKDANETTKQLTFGKRIASLLFEGELSAEKLSELQSESEDDMTATASEVFSGRKASNETRVRVKGADESYSEKRYIARNKHGSPMVDPMTGCEVETISEAAAARHGVLLKHLANRSGCVQVPLDEHERNMLADLTSEKSAWCGKVGSEHVENMSGLQTKALIDDAVSGGIEVVPIEFDRDVISFPLLHSELLPHVDLKPVPRGRRVEGASIATPTMAWGGGDNVAIDLFNTAGMTQPIDTTIFTVDGCLEVGRDFMSDTPIEVGSTLTRLVGERLSAELDRVLAIGNGTTQPEGLFTAAGVTTINTANAGAGPPTVADWLSLLFSLDKQYRAPNMRSMFICNDTTYQRARSIAVGAGDQRLVLGMDADAGSGAAVEGYSLLGRPCKIVNAIGNRSACIAAMSRYRLYRRLGLEVRWESGGVTLARRNMMLLVFRARFGGRLMDANGLAKWEDGQA